MTGTEFSIRFTIRSCDFSQLGFFSMSFRTSGRDTVSLSLVPIMYAKCTFVAAASKQLLSIDTSLPRIGDEVLTSHIFMLA